MCQQTNPVLALKHFMFPDFSSKMLEGYITNILMGFINARCISFSLDRILYREKQDGAITGLGKMIAFCVYLPLVVMGPLVKSSAFKQSFEKLPEMKDLKFVKKIFIQTLRFSFWFLVTEISLCFIYQGAFSKQVIICRGSNYKNHTKESG